MSIAKLLRNGAFAFGFMSLGATAALSMEADARPGPGAEAGQSMRSHRPGAGGSGQHIRRLAENLDLSDEQKEVLRGVGEQFRAERMEEHRAQLTSVGELQELLATDDVNRRSVHKMIDRGLDEKAERIHATADLLLDFVETLDAEQRAQLITNMQDMQSRGTQHLERMEQRRSRPAESSPEPAE